MKRIAYELIGFAGQKIAPQFFPHHRWRYQYNFLSEETGRLYKGWDACFDEWWPENNC